jgi:hypothetical protein
LWDLSLKTVESHRENIKRKLHLRSGGSCVSAPPDEWRKPSMWKNMFALAPATGGKEN